MPDNPASPAGFTIDLPSELQGRSDAFTLTDPQGAAVGQCTVTATQLDCALSSAYIAANPVDLRGTFRFWVTVLKTVNSSETVTFDVGGTSVTTVVTPPPAPGGPCTENCAFAGRDNAKGGNYDPATGYIRWTVTIGSGPDGMVGGNTVTVTDTPGGNQELVTQIAGESMPTLWEAPGTYVNSGGVEVPGPWAPADRSSYTSTPDSVTFVTQEGYFYDVQFATRVTDGGTAGSYKNSATIVVGNTSGTPVNAVVVRQGGDGTGEGSTPTPTPTPPPGSTPPPSPTPASSPTPSPSVTTSTPSPDAVPSKTGMLAETGAPSVLPGVAFALTTLAVAVLLLAWSRWRIRNSRRS
ncbi:hypothetical protein [Microbacterium sp. Yaish 1]|uniref:hypothetical protein n=1 Tax=Microbacterium sp. Yaish 1 TaxID=2025014 RepID=UPI000B93DCC6|nr:hypothetical protein [Microbacterium sp. Yaish 1]OYC98396.1 hypothetical protein CI089_07990 [Microbacterium sp. Yaish 1]